MRRLVSRGFAALPLVVASALCACVGSAGSNGSSGDAGVAAPSPATGGADSSAGAPADVGPGEAQAPADAGADAPAADCPPEMASAGARLCIDRYEASQVSPGRPASMAGKPPWANVTWDAAKAACESVGKRLCADDEWVSACQGPSKNAFPYGNDYDAGACNDFQAAFRFEQPTGQFPRCEGGWPGLFDMCGNLAEWSATCNAGACHVRGGDFDDNSIDSACISAKQSDPTTKSGRVGFRCCLTR